MELLISIPWQDWIFSIGNLLLFLALFPSIRSEHKPALGTSVMTASILTAFAVSFLTLSLWLSATFTFLVAAGWYVLAFQRFRRTK